MLYLGSKKISPLFVLQFFYLLSIRVPGFPSQREQAFKMHFSSSSFVCVCLCFEGEGLVVLEP